MSTRRYKITITDGAALAAAYPAAVTATTIPEHTEYEVHYAIVAKLLDCDIVVPGIELEPETQVKRL